jgi:hypothetical protein
VLGDLRELLGLMTRLELLGMEQVVDQQQGRADDERRRRGAPVQPEMRERFDGGKLAQRRRRLSGRVTH